MYKSQASIAASLLRHGANVNCRNSVGNTPLLLAMQKGPPQLVKLLLSHHASPHALRISITPLLLEAAFRLIDDDDNDTPLARENSRSVFLFLLAAGLDPNEPNVYGSSATAVILTDPKFWGLLFGLTLNLDTTPPYPRLELGAYRDPICSLGHKSFPLLIRHFGAPTLCRVLNLHPEKDPDPLLMAAHFGL